jgi:hypothetical protein
VTTQTLTAATRSSYASPSFDHASLYNVFIARQLFRTESFCYSQIIMDIILFMLFFYAFHEACANTCSVYKYSPVQSDAVGLYTGSTWDGLPTAIMWISPVACLTRMLLIPVCIQMLKLGNVTGAVQKKLSSQCLLNTVC